MNQPMHLLKHLFLIFSFATVTVAVLVAEASPVSPPLRHAISFYGEPKYGPDFTHFGFTNPDAPKGGELKQGVIGYFDSLVPYIDRGTAAAGSQMMYDSLLARSWDEPLTKYGLIAEKIELDPDNNWVAFHINPKAYFHDGKPVTAKDVKFSFDLLREKGSTFYKNFYLEVERVEVTDTYRALFIFNTNKNRELPLILGQMPILPEHYWKNRDFSSPGLEIPVSSGPYKAVRIDAGRSIVYERVKDYWAQNIPAMKGRNNFDKIQYSYYRDRSVLIEALRKGDFDLETITNAQTWQEFSTLPTKENKRSKNTLVTETITNHNPQTLTIAYNTRRPFLQDTRVRKALGYGVDYDWMNHHLFYGMYQRATSFFAGTELAATGLPSDLEKQLLTPWKDRLPEALFDQPWVPPGGEPGLTSRDRKKKALSLLKEAGWIIKNNRQINSEGKTLDLEVLIATSNYERIMIPVQKELEKFGIKLHIRSVDTAQYIERLRNQDFDLILHTFPHTPSPGTEQANHWASAAADTHGTRNITGVKMPVIDQLTLKIPEVRSRKELVGSVRAMDRVLLWSNVALPLWYQPDWNLVRKSGLRHPVPPAPYALDLSTWWYQP